MCRAGGTLSGRLTQVLLTAGHLVTINNTEDFCVIKKSLSGYKKLVVQKIQTPSENYEGHSQIFDTQCLFELSGIVATAKSKSQFAWASIRFTLTRR